MRQVLRLERSNHDDEDGGDDDAIPGTHRRYIIHFFKLTS